MSPPNPLIFKAISVLFEEPSQQFECGASGGAERRRGRERGTRRRVSPGEGDPQEGLLLGLWEHGAGQGEQTDAGVRPGPGPP